MRTCSSFFFLMIFILGSAKIWSQQVTTERIRLVPFRTRLNCQMEFESTQALEGWKRLSRSGMIWCASEFLQVTIYQKMRRAVAPETRRNSSLWLPIILLISLDSAQQFCVAVRRSDLRLIVGGQDGRILFEDAAPPCFRGSTFRLSETMPADEHYLGSATRRGHFDAAGTPIRCGIRMPTAFRSPLIQSTKASPSSWPFALEWRLAFFSITRGAPTSTLASSRLRPILRRRRRAGGFLYLSRSVASPGCGVLCMANRHGVAAAALDAWLSTVAFQLYARVAPDGDWQSPELRSFSC